ncbi:MAG: hypothetical protein ACK4FJ_16945 [Ferrovibrio sp.]|uniref:hypothetical protein n=1 Tax=Ferrovibrio sp. TaxID=1917215 RepID=UPI00391B52F7
MAQVKHSLFIGVILAVLGTASVSAQDWRYGHNVYRDSFFDFASAKANWTALKSDEQLKNYRKANCPAGNEYERWAKRLDVDRKAAMSDLDKEQNAETIKRCHDLYLMAYKWDELWGYWRAAPSRIRKWNGLEQASNACAAIRRSNIFTGQCNDLPDWQQWRVGN